jgi:hypothetical protein
LESQAASRLKETHSLTLCICSGCRYGLDCGVPSDGGAATLGGRVEGEKSPGLEAGVLAAVFDIMLKSIVERQQTDDCRHV